MFKHLKTFIIATVLTFSFISSVNALYTTYGELPDVPNVFSNQGFTIYRAKNFNTGLYQPFLLVFDSPTDTTAKITVKNGDFYRFVFSTRTRLYSLKNNSWYNEGLWSSFSTDLKLDSDEFIIASSIPITSNVSGVSSYPTDYGLQAPVYTFNFHLNGGHATTNLIGFIPYLVFNDSEFSFSTENGDFETFLTSLDIKKDDMIFDGLYYDPNFTQPLTLNDNFNDYAMVVDDQKVINLYAKYRYKNVDDFLSNVNFNEYTFDTNYDYAIINRGDNSNSVYIGLPFNNYELEIYEYQENTNSYKEGSSACLVPIFNKNHQYYYELNTLFTHNQEVLILPRQMFDQLDPNTFDDPGDAYKFYLTDNAYVTYTTDLTHVTITNSQGQQIDTNLQNSFELSQQYKNLYENEKDIYAQIKIFLNNITRYTTAIKGMFQYLFNSLNSTIRSFIIFLVLLILLSTILRFIRRG